MVSIFLGDELNGVLEAIDHETPYQGAARTKMKLGVDILPKFSKDTTDRNRTSPFAFTGNKFEFRMVGSSDSIACANIMINTAVAESLKLYADRLEGAENFPAALQELLRQTIREHKRIIFNGNGYDDAWITEATEKRGLLNYRTTPDCVPHLLDEKNVRLLTSHGVLTLEELTSRYEVMMENYCKTILIEANTMVDMARTEILPAVESFALDTARGAAAKRELVPGCPCGYESELVKKLSALTDQMAAKTAELEQAVLEVSSAGDIAQEAAAVRDVILCKMGQLRLACDEAETLTPKKYWPFPTYGDLLFGVR